MQRSESIAAIAAALAKAQGQIEGAIKGNMNPAFRSKYADLGAVWDAIREPLAGNGLAVLQQLTTEENRVACTTILLHSSGEWIEFAPFVVPVSKQDAQGFGSAATYCRRYSLMASVGIAPIDDDGEAAVGRSEKKRDAAPAAPQMPPGLLEAAQEAALGGTEHFRAYWKAASPEARQALAKHIPSLKEAAERADLPTEMIEAAE
jgi:hypothetical protein